MLNILHLDFLCAFYHKSVVTYNREIYLINTGIIILFYFNIIVSEHKDLLPIILQNFYLIAILPALIMNILKINLP